MATTHLGDNQGTSGTSGSLTTGANVAKGDTILVTLATTSTVSNGVTFSDSAGNNYTVDAPFDATANTCVARSIAATALPSGSTISYTLGSGSTSASAWTMSADTEPGGWTPDGSVPAWGGVTSSPTSSASCSSTAGDFVYGAAVMFAAGTFSVTSVSTGYTLLASVGTNTRKVATAAQESVPGTSASITFNWSATHSQRAILIPYKAASSGVSGSSAQTLPHVTQSASGSVTVPSFTGAAAQTIPPISQAAAGAVTPPAFTGAAASALPPVAQTASGAVTAPGFTGTAASTLPAVAQSAAGSATPPGFTGTAAQTLPPVTQAADGTVTAPAFTGGVAQTLPALVQDAAGTATGPPFTGVVAQTLPRLRQKARQNPPPHARSVTVGLPLTSRRVGVPATRANAGRPLTKTAVGATVASSD